jgi:hypothetical protein
MTAGGTGEAVTVSQRLQAYCGRMWRWRVIGGLDVELLADVFADLDEGRAALAAGAGFRLVAVFDARQVRRQRLPPALPPAAARRGRAVCAGRRG